ncbi:MAG: hypothetical protein ACYCSI_08255 [Solirubrobacteraceae bacterium]
MGAQAPEDIERFAVVRVTDLPFAHNPYKCRHRARFDTLCQRQPTICATQVGMRWHATLTADDFAACRITTETGG